MPYLDYTGLSYLKGLIDDDLVGMADIDDNVVSLNSAGKIPAEFIPDVYKEIIFEYDSTFEFPPTGNVGYIYFDKEGNSYYRYDGIKYVLLYSKSFSNYTVYSYHIDGSESDPSAKVTYTGATTGMSPAYMDYTNDTFVWGSWGNAFFLPKPCMLKPDGTVDFYLDASDYTKKENGTPSHIGDLGIVELTTTAEAEHLTGSYFCRGETLYQATDDIAIGDTIALGTNCINVPGINALDNAMMEWGQNGKRIYYKIVPDDGDNTSATVYIADQKIDSDYACWSFINQQGKLVDHFYTSIYNTSLIPNADENVLRSISNVSAISNIKIGTFRNYAKANNPNSLNIWDLGTYSDHILIILLLVLISKSTNGQQSFGYGFVRNSFDARNNHKTGSKNDKGLFYGTEENVTQCTDSTNVVKIFGMENYWGLFVKYILGACYYQHERKYKLAYSQFDGTFISDYCASDDIYDSQVIKDLNKWLSYDMPTSVSINSGYITNLIFSKYEIHPDYNLLASGTYTTNYCDSAYFSTSPSGIHYMYIGSNYSAMTSAGPFYIGHSNTSIDNGSVSLSCRPLKQEVE